MFFNVELKELRMDFIFLAVVNFRLCFMGKIPDSSRMLLVGVVLKAPNEIRSAKLMIVFNFLTVVFEVCP